MSYSIVLKSKFTGEQVMRQDFSVEDFLNNCGYRLFSMNNGNSYILKGDKRDAAIKLINVAVYNWLIKEAYTYNTGVRKIVMSGSFGAVGKKVSRYVGTGLLGNPTAVFMLSEDVALVGEATTGKESGEHVLQMGEINMSRDMKARPLPTCHKLYELSIGTPKGW